ncbi:DUF490 domain-containing protein [Bacteroidia bacterium]|nr:DUF490 domain-containing protein [Bacteroidia bacterium]
MYTFAALVGVVGLVYLLLWLPPVQRKVKDFVLDIVVEKTHNRMSIGTLTFRPFNHLQLEDVYVEDLQHDTLFYAAELSAGFDIWEMLNNHLLVKSVDAADFVINIDKNTPDSAYNFQFLVDAFVDPADTTTASSMRIELRDITLSGGRVNYDADSLAVYLSDIQTIMDLKSIDLDNLDVNVKQFSFAENSGFQLKNLQFQILSRDNSLNVNDFVLELPRSQIQLPNGRCGFDLHASQPITDYQMAVGGHIDFADIAMLMPAVSHLTDILTFSGEISGTLPEIAVTAFQADYGKRIHLNATGAIQDYEHLETSPVRLDLKQLAVNGLRQAFEGVAGQGGTDMPMPLGIDLSGSLGGTLADLVLNLRMGSDKGDISVDGQGGYDLKTGAAKFDANAAVSRFNVGFLMQDTLFGFADLTMGIKGELTPKGDINGEAQLDVQRFDFQGYAYSKIHAEAAVQGNAIRVKAQSDDPTVQFRLRSEIAGFDPEKMQASLFVNRLELSTDNGCFIEPRFRLTYQAEDSAHKHLSIASQHINATVDGKFTYTGLTEVFKENFPVLFGYAKVYPKLKDKFDETMTFRVSMNHLNSLAEALELPQTIPDSILFTGKYSHAGEKLKFSASAYTLFTASDTIQLSLSLTKVGDFPRVLMEINNHSNTYNLDGAIDVAIEMLPHIGQAIPDMNITLNPSVWVLNDTWFDMNPATVEIRDGRYTIRDFSVSMSDHPDEYVKINGTASTLRDDSLTIDVSRFQIGSLLNAAKMPVPLSGMADGRITTRQILAKPFVLSRGFAVKDIIYAGNELGNLSVTSGFSGARNSVFIRASLGKGDAVPSVVSGMLLPEKDSMSLTANIQDIELKWFKDATAGMLYGLDGKIATKLKISGTMSRPEIAGQVYFNKAQMGITMLNTKYSLNDSIEITPHAVNFNKMTIMDENKHTLVANGSITHDWFINPNPKISLTMSDFQVLNNTRQTDSLIYGNLRLNGLLNIKRSNRDWLVTGTLTHANNSKVTLNVPFSASTAERYNSITYVDSTWTPLTAIADKTTPQAPDAETFPLKVEFSIWLDRGLTMGAVLDPSTGNTVQMAGNGAITVKYDMTAPMASALNVTGDYTVENGNVSMSVANLVRKSFAIQENGKLVFHGNPMATTFDMTAIYKTRADLNILDPSFDNIVANPKVAVNCELSVSGSMEKMTLGYDVKLPGESEDVNRKMAGLLSSDNLKVKEMAYLLAFNTFTPLRTDATETFASGRMLSSLASLTTGQLSKALSNALGDNWSIGADVRSKDDFNNVDMDLNVSTAIFDDRLTINGTVGYSNDPSKRQNFTGDFDIEYKLIPTGNILLQVYNATNNQYYEQAPTTQGVGVVYKKNARTFGGLFRKIGKK